jgi:hypothetical protein
MGSSLGLADQVRAEQGRLNGDSAQTFTAEPVVAQPPSGPLVVQSPVPGPPPPPGTPVIVPSPPTVVVPPSIPQVLQADDIEASEVRAHTVYANKIKASQIQGAVFRQPGSRSGSEPATA